MSGHKTLPPPPSTPPRQLTESNMTAEECVRQGEFGVELGLRSKTVGETLTKGDVVVLTIRLLCMATSVTAMSFMVTARQVSVASFYGFQLQLHSKWSFSYSFEYVVGVTATATAYSLVQLLIATSRLLVKKSPAIPSRNQAWLVFAGDQILAYAMVSAGSAASGVTNLNRTGIRHTVLPNFCKSLDSFCDHVTVSIAFTFFGCVMYSAAAVQDVMWLASH
ncbi:CASP-like protein 3A1 [Hibiscus syriacus]|uniref:CASP-like protein n=1 Tax=Hibiscus syriacus TaxID=106335 RepID=A0A6A3AZW0_HIBSY|nr:CASP-like protein 3A2 [Hibiscus syriacus]KAE8709178.1 CASP-like protein 3A1 [Hibiscus syriacus]